MAVVIRLQRVGKKNQPSYRLAVVDRRFKRDGRFIEIVGNYAPLKKENTLVIRHDRIQYWVSQGAQVSDRIRSFLASHPAPAAVAGAAAAAPAPKADKAGKPAPAPKAEKPTAAPKAEKPKAAAKPASKKPAK